jgi:hypothetical protein
MIWHFPDFLYSMRGPRRAANHLVGPLCFQAAPPNFRFGLSEGGVHAYVVVACMRGVFARLQHTPVCVLPKLTQQTGICMHRCVSVDLCLGPLGPRAGIHGLAHCNMPPHLQHFPDGFLECESPCTPSVQLHNDAQQWWGS